MRIAAPSWPPDVGAGPDVLFKEARRRQRRRYLVAGLAIVVALAGIAGLTVGLAGPGGHSSVREAPRRVAHRGESTSPVPAWANRLEGEVAYQCGDYICLMRPDGTRERNITALFPEWDPSWSPDGRRLAFPGNYSIAEGDYAIYLIGADGCHLTKLAVGTSPSWSPDGRRIAFAGGGINVINSNGTGLRHLTRDTTYEDDSPAWSVRNRIAFVRTRIPTRAEIYMMNPDGSGQTPLTHGGHGFSQPAWSPDGRQIAFAAAVGHSNAIGSPMVIEVANADGTGARTVSPPAWASYNPVWTPGGKLVFLAQQGTRTNAYVITPDGTGLRLLYPGQAITLGSQIAWGPAALPPARC